MRGSPFSFSNFSRGVNAIDSPYTLTEGEARDVLNMVSSPRGAVKKRYGSTVFASTAAPYFPTLAVTDSFVRAPENPLSNAGKWTAIGANAGLITENAWECNSTGTGPTKSGNSNARWNVAEQTNPAVQLQVGFVGKNNNFGVYACLNAAGTLGYLVEAHKTGVAGVYQVVTKREDVGEIVTTLATVASVPFSVGDVIGITVRAGIVTAWRYESAVAAWTVLSSSADATYTKGYSGVYASYSTSELTSGSRGKYNNFATGEAPAIPTEAEFTSLLPCRVGGVNYLIAVAGTQIFSVTEAGEITNITGGATITAGLRWSMIQSTSGAPNRVTADGPIFLSNGVNPPLYWTGATKATNVAEWTSKPEGAFVAVPKAKYLTYLGNRVWASGISADTSALRFSGFSVKAEEGEQADPTNWPKENVVWFEKDDGDAITGTGIAGAYLMVFKKHKTWAVYDLNEGENRRLSDNIGCISYRSIVETPAGTFFLTPDQGVFVTNGTSLHEVSRNVRPILQGTDSQLSRAAKLNELENAAAGYLNGHYYLSYMAQDGSMKTLDYDTVLQSWWIHDLAGNQWVRWEPVAGSSFLYTVPRKAKAGIVKAFVPGVYQDSGLNYTGGHGLTCYWFSPWEPFWQYFMRHRFSQPNPKKRIRELFVDGKGELVTVVARKFGSTLETLLGTVDAEDMAAIKTPLTLGTSELETQAARYWSLGISRVWCFGFGNNSAEPLEIDSYSVHLDFRKS